MGPRCMLTVTMDFVEAIPVAAPPVPRVTVRRKRLPPKCQTEIVQIWDDLAPQPGRRTDRPWGATHEAWDAARKRFERRAYVHQARAPQEIRRRMLGHLKRVCRDLAHAPARLWVEPVEPVETPEVPQLTRIETLFQPASSTSPAMVRMILAGRMPGFEWDPSRGVVQVRTAIRVRPVGGAQ